MKMKKNVMAVLLLFGVALGVGILDGVQNVHARAAAEEAAIQQPMTAAVEVIQVDEPFDNPRVEALFGPMSRKQALVINGEINYLYPTFDDLETALEKFQAAAPEYYTLASLGRSWKLCYGWESLVPYRGIPRFASQETKEKLASQEEIYRSFCDIFEDEARNREIVEYVTSGKTLDRMQLVMMLPYTAPLVQEGEAG